MADMEAGHGLCWRVGFYIHVERSGVCKWVLSLCDWFAAPTPTFPHGGGGGGIQVMVVALRAAVLWLGNLSPVCSWCIPSPMGEGRAGTASNCKIGISIHKPHRAPSPAPQSSPAAGFALRGRGGSVVCGLWLSIIWFTANCQTKCNAFSKCTS